MSKQYYIDQRIRHYVPGIWELSDGNDPYIDVNPSLGIAWTPPSPGMTRTTDTLTFGGAGGVGPSAEAGAQLRSLPSLGGGAGMGFLEPGGRGGGSLVVLAHGAIAIEGAINAKGETPTAARAGGGGGGALVIGSATSISIGTNGKLDVSAGAGGAGKTDAPPGGGGGGGLIHLLSPTITVTATPTVLDIAGGAAGALVAGQLDTVPRTAGGGGGASFGDGGAGGGFDADGSITAATDGVPGKTMTTKIAPGAGF